MSVLPSLFVQRVYAFFPHEADHILSCMAHSRGVGLRLNPLKSVDAARRADWEVLWAKTRIVDHQRPWMRFLPADEFSEADWAPFLQDGVVVRQSLASQWVTVVLSPQPEERILDLCAAPGGKTAHIAARMNNTGSITAVDVSRTRLYRMRALLQRLGVTNTREVLCDGRVFKDRRPFDRVLVDAPCSCESRFSMSDSRTHRYWSVRKIHECAHKQKRLLRAAVRLVRSGGCVVYATCTLSPEENEEVVAAVLHEFRDELVLEDVPVGPFGRLAAVVPPVSRSEPIWSAIERNCLRIRPDQRCESFFIARLRRRT